MTWDLSTSHIMKVIYFMKGIPSLLYASDTLPSPILRMYSRVSDIADVLKVHTSGRTEMYAFPDVLAYDSKSQVRQKCGHKPQSENQVAEVTARSASTV